MIFFLPVARKWARPVSWSFRSDPGISFSETVWPTTCSRRYPNIFSAAGLNAIIRPLPSIATMPSSDDSTNASRHFRGKFRFGLRRRKLFILYDDEPTAMLIFEKLFNQNTQLSHLVFR